MPLRMKLESGRKQIDLALRLPISLNLVQCCQQTDVDVPEKVRHMQYGNELW